ncbi:MAG: formate dehydrogenase accessory sulfurtransferase FdhD [Dehalococcoidia bacterium]|nr:formate dehydrogenase accessory sulfurtransferase FdhD [Dehalococcoidia bacterium]
MTTSRGTRRADVQNVRLGQAPVAREDMLAVEEPLEIRLEWTEQDRLRVEPISVTMRTPGQDLELAAGFLLSEGVLRAKEDVERIGYCTEVTEQHYNVVAVRLAPGVRFDHERLRRNFYTTSSCGVCGKVSLEALQIQECPILPKGRPAVTPEVMARLPDQLRKAQPGFAKTGGLHAAGLFDAEGTLLYAFEDVGRHNAVDKLTGHALLTGRLPLSEHILAVSGRSSFEIMQKALMAGIAVVVAVGAPSTLAVDVARQFGMTLAGFTRTDGFNLYADAERVTGHRVSDRVSDRVSEKPT